MAIVRQREREEEIDCARQSREEGGQRAVYASGIFFGHLSPAPQPVDSQKLLRFRVQLQLQLQERFKLLAPISNVAQLQAS